MCISLQASPASAVPTSANRIGHALRVSELHYRRLFEMACDGILILDSDYGKITDANPCIAELLGYSQSELLGRQLWEIGLLGKEAAQKALSQLREQGQLRCELTLKTHRGDTREVEFAASVYRENGHSVIQCTVRDVTERKRTEARRTIAVRNERIAETVQCCLLQSPRVGKFRGLAVETLYKAALSEAPVGGDFFDAFALNGPEVALVVGDVTGKGLIAAGRTAEVKYALRAFLHEHRTLAIALTHLNNFICETHGCDPGDAEVFITLAVVVVNTSTGEATFTSAGAEPTLILRAGGSVEAVEIPGLPLGIRPDVAYTVKTLTLGMGEALLMATDGITEARRGSAFLGIEGMAALAEQVGPAALLQDLSQAIYGGACAFAGGKLHDDACLLLARRQ
ncbi:MAG: SpoIIE family protein phosphatase [Janthinobacterium lividum]